MAKSNLVQVAPNELIARRGDETDAEVRARFKRRQDAEREVSRLSDKLDNYTNRKRSDETVKELITDVGLAIPRALTQRKYMKAKENLKSTYAKGGTASKRGDGCAQRGKTKGKMV